jgi:hypothetical protein
LPLQDEKNQLLITNMWLKMVSLASRSYLADDDQSKWFADKWSYFLARCA